MEGDLRTLLETLRDFDVESYEDDDVKLVLRPASPDLSRPAPPRTTETTDPQEQRRRTALAASGGIR